MRRFFPVLALAAGVAVFALGIRWIADNCFLPPTQFITTGSPGPYTGPTVRWEENSGSAPGPVSASASVPPEAAAKLKTLQEILRSKNDNDPRLDHEFNDLSPEAKTLFEVEYRRIPAEKRNERGTIVYLIGRNLKTPADWDFLRNVALEPPCLSLSDCSRRPAPGGDEEATGDEITLAYPSLVALRQAQMALEKVSALGAGAKATREEAMRLFAAAKGSKTRVVARKAALLERKFALH